MRFVSVRDLRGKSAEVWKSLAEERELVLTSNGKPFAIITATDEASFERSLQAIRRARAAAAVRGMQDESRRRGSDRMSIAEIDAQIEAARAERVSKAKDRLEDQSKT
jgi:antitoxin (DNA-binding transcriptional repressor) of toxin-antitoxin stability system